jgi:hypothetical protein
VKATPINTYAAQKLATNQTSVRAIGMTNILVGLARAINGGMRRKKEEEGEQRC